MRVFITGATGYVGRAVVARLLQDGDEVVALVRSRYRARDLETRGARLVVADISDVERVFPVGVDAVVHCAFSLFPASDPRVNVEGSLRLMRGTLFLAREDTQLSLTELADLVEAVALALRRPIRPGEIFNVCAPVGVSTAALYAGLAAILRVTPPRRLPKPAIFAAGALCQGLFEAVGVVPPFNLDIARLATMRAGPRSIDCARTRLGFEPRWSDPCAAILATYAQREAQAERGSPAAVRT